MLVVNPNNRLKTHLAAIEPPLWAGLIASYHAADMLDAEAEDLTLEETELAIRCSQHRDVMLVVMGNNPSVSSTPKMAVAEALADRIKDLNVFFTGLHPIAVNYKQYPVVAKPFDGFPMMPWEKLPMHLYRAHNWHCLDGSPRSPYASIYTSLGCPYSCYFCNVHALYGARKVQFRPVPDILKEVEILATHYQVRNIKFWDELFTLDQKRVLAICDGVKDYHLNIWAYARLDSVNEVMLKAMKAGGINWVAYGFESVTDKKIVARTDEVIKMTRDAGINIIANFMFGLPGDTEDTQRATLAYAQKYLFEFVNFYDAKPYPGSKWYEDSHPKLAYGDYSQYQSRSAFRRHAFQQYFTNPAYLDMATKKFGQQVLGQIKEMLEWQF